MDGSLSRDLVWRRTNGGEHEAARSSTVGDRQPQDDPSVDLRPILDFTKKKEGRQKLIVTFLQVDIKWRQ